MIARIRQTEPESRPRGLRRAHRLVAATMLKKPRHAADGSSRVPAWRAWLFTFWVLVVTVAYSAYLIGLVWTAQ